MKAAPAQAVVLLADLGDAAVLAAAQQGLRQFGTALCVHPPPAAAAAGALPPRLVLGLCNLAQPPQAPKPVLQVRYRPAPFALRDFHAAVGRLQPAASGGNGGTAGGSVPGAMAAVSLGQLVGLVAQDAACAAAGPRKAVLYLTDRLDYEPDDFRPCLEMCRGKGVQVEMVFLAANQQQQPAAGTAGGQEAPQQAGVAFDEGSGAGAAAGAGTVEALAAAWEAAEADFPHLSVTVVPSASRISFDALASTLLQRCAGQQQLLANLTFKQPLLGGIRSLQLSCRPEIRPLAQSVQHAVLCPCHRAPAAWAGTAAACSVSGAPLDRRQCGRDERTVQVGPHPGGALHLPAPFNIAAGGGGSGSGPASLNVNGRIKADQANPALMFGLPLMLAAPQPSPAVKVVHDGELSDVSTHQLLDTVCTSLSASQEALLATCTTDLECGAAGLFRLHYVLLPCVAAEGRPAALCAKRLACAEELLAPLLAPAPADGTATGALSPALVEAVGGQLGQVPLAAVLDPLTLSGRAADTVEMLVRESQPLPKLQAPPAAAAPPGAVAVTAGPQPPQAPMAVVPPTAPAVAAVPPPAPAGRSRRAGAGAAGAVPAARESGGQRGAGGSKAGKGALEFKRSTRR